VVTCWGSAKYYRNVEIGPPCVTLRLCYQGCLSLFAAPFHSEWHLGVVRSGLPILVCSMWFSCYRRNTDLRDLVPVLWTSQPWDLHNFTLYFVYEAVNLIVVNDDVAYCRRCMRLEDWGCQAPFGMIIGSGCWFRHGFEHCETKYITELHGDQ